jgi:hypothetical protein
MHGYAPPCITIHESKKKKKFTHIQLIGSYHTMDWMSSKMLETMYYIRRQDRWIQSHGCMRL